MNFFVWPQIRNESTPKCSKPMSRGKKKKPTKKKNSLPKTWQRHFEIIDVFNQTTKTLQWRA